METNQIKSEQIVVGSELTAPQTIHNLQQTTPETNIDQKRRSSSRSIKRKRFDDEIVEYSLGFPPSTFGRVGRARTQSQSYVNQYTGPPTATVTATAISTPPTTTEQTSAPSTTTSTTATAAAATAATTVTAHTTTVHHHSHQTPSSAPPIPIQMPSTPLTPFINIEKRKPGKPSKKNKKGRGTSQITTKDLGRWKPIDDLALIIGIQQTNDLRMVHRGTKFSCKFTVQEMQSRWYSLLYEEPISRIAVAAMRNLHPELVESVQSKALYATQEEDLLGTIKSTDNPTLETFQELLDKNASVFFPARTAKSLYNHWQLMKQYCLLPDQTVKTFPNDDILSFSDAEDTLIDAELNEPRDEALEIELALADRKNKREIRQLENELSRWTVLVDSLTGIGFTPEFDNQTLAVLRGRLVRYLMRSKEITFGRSSKDMTVDVDLSLEGPAYKISRKQGTIKLRSNGDFFVSNEGKRPIYIDGVPLLQGNKSRLNNNCVVEISGLRFVFLVNYDLINAIRHESAKTTVPLN